ncbi:palmitoyltransferase ZDHHC3-A-like isoform X2 [Ruditapes philippinarum]|nr:palmitoyltransferase ZDHHC3-A-like isoform X2 [Ruditapes philippinarum]XP_060572211.1 palmitoyltransferase ZDHHC3-A-like isoform X2 [Ruditapes philippinarum]
MALRRLTNDDKTLPETVDDDDTNLSFHQKLMKNARKNAKEGKRSFKMIVFIMIFQSTTELYAFMHYIIPYMFQDYSPWTRYYMNVLIWYVVMNMLANWFCVMLYSAAYPKTKDNPYLRMEQHDTNLPDHFAARIEQASSQSGANGHCVYDMTTKEGLPWNFCDKCSMHVPFRTHHCDSCKACILKRDHHCYLVGTCIGFKNQRYWIILTFYVTINCIICGIFVFKYVCNVVWPELTSWSDLLLPLTIWRTIFRNISALHCILIMQLYIDLFFSVLAFVYFNSQMVITLEGKTLFEVAKKVPIKNTNSFNTNMKSVFGDFWGLNFLFPMTLVFRQRDDGIHWDGIKIDHNANEKDC